tara:strand:+ start:1178 stop:3670 length:2493 start_codon:yes stop_codon:yes gene_type:complete
MPKRILQIKDFSGGINTLKDPADIADNELANIENLSVKTHGSITPAYLNTDSSNNKISGYNNNTIATINAGYGLGYFETDHVRDAVEVEYDSSTHDVNNGFDLLEIDGTVRTNAGNDRRFNLKTSGTDTNLTTSFPIGSRILLTGVSTHTRSFAVGKLSASAQGVYTVVDHDSNDIIVDRQVAVRMGEGTNSRFSLNIKGWSMGDNVLLLANPADHKIDVYSRNSSTNWLNDAITLRADATDTTSKVKYYKVEDEIRCCDTADKNDCKIQWYGWIQRRHFTGASTTNDANSYMGFYAKDNTLAPPTEDDLTSASTASPANFTTYPASAGTGFEFNIITHTDVDGTISATTYELASTFIYDGNQESLPFKYANTHTIASENDLCALSLNVSAKGPYDPRISGGRIYIRELGTDSEYIMLVDIDLSKGCRTKFSDDYTDWHDAGSSQYNCPTATATANFEVTEFGLLTYEIINGFSSSIFSNYIGDQGEYWKDSVVANNRAFVCDVTIKDENTGSQKSNATLKRFPDRIMYSMPNRFDTFPYHNYIEASKGDADVYTAIDSYGDRLLAFKNRSLDIINISSPDDANWFLEETKQYMGVSWHEAVKRTQYGLLWVNEQGLFLYNGNQIINLKENKIDNETWIASVTSNSAILYDERSSLAYITRSYAGSASGYTVDLKKGTFVKTTNFLLVANYTSNSVDTEDNVLIAYDAGSSIDIYQLYRTEVANTCDFQTKDYDFGDPSTSKKIYAVYVTYKSDAAITNFFTLVEDDGTSHALSGTIATSSSNYSTVKITPSSPVTCNKISVKFDSSSNARKLFINDIGIEYRILKKRAS